MIANNFPCVCGHTSKKHCIIGMRDGIRACSARKFSGDFEDSCMRFKQDNLKYLQQKYEESNKIS